MKKITFIILIVVLALALGIGIYYKVKIVKLPIERILPEGAIVYVRISDIEKSWQEFSSTRLGWNIKNIDVELLLQESGLTQAQIEQYSSFKSKFFRAAAGLLLDKFFGQEVALALYPSKISTFDAEAMLNITSNIILVTRLKPEAEFVEFVSKLFNKAGQSPQIKYEKYKGHQISIVELTDKLNITYVKIRDLLVLGLGKQAAFACLDVVGKARASLAQDKDYVLIMSELPQTTRTVAFGNLELFFSNFKRFIDIASDNGQIPVEEEMNITELVDKIAGFKTVGLASVSGKIAKDKILMTFDKSQMDPALAQAYSFKPQRNSTINFVPKNIIGYQWSSYDPRLAWVSFQQELSQRPEQFSRGPAPADIITAIEDKLGMSIEDDIIPALGNETGGFLTDINLAGPIPLPEILLFVKIKDKTVIQRAIETWAENGNLSWRSEEYQDKLIRYISLPAGINLQPGYCFLDSYLLISTRHKLLKESIDTLSDGSMSLLANKDFQSVNLGITDKNNAIFFLQTDLLLQRLRGISEWAFGWLSLMSASLETYQQKAEQSLDDLRKDIQVKESELNNLKTNLQSLKAEIKNLQSQGLDISHQQQKSAALEAKIKEKKEKIDLASKDLAEKEKELKDVLQKSPLAKIRLSLVRLYLDELVYPILDGLKTNKAMASRSIIRENIFEIQSFSKTEE